jgi:multisubunit Na+/H+ antiporter MnhE subunit
MPASLSAAGRWLVRWTLLMGLWLVLIDTAQWPELGAGAVAAAIGATVAGLIVRPGRPKTATKSLDLMRLGPRRLGRPLVRLVADTAVVTRALARSLAGRAPRGSFRVVRYAPDAPRRSAAGRAMTEIWGSLTPNRYVIGTDDDEGILMVHELVRRDEPIDPLAER